MSVPGRQPKYGDEMFFDPPPERQSPIVEPLRINKRSSAASPTPSNSSLQSAGRQNNAGGGTVYPMPALPYPDGNVSQNTRPQQQSPLPSVRLNGSPANNHYPYPDIRRATSPEYVNPTQASGSATSGDSGRYFDNRSPATLAERRGNSAVKPLPDSPGPEAPDKDGLFAKPFQRDTTANQQHMYPPPSGGDSGQAAFARLQVQPSAINRLDSTASTSTTKAQRGSPPPPETPVVGPGQPLPTGTRPQTDIEARYAASGIAGSGTLTALQAQSMAAQQRAANYAGMQTSTQNPPPARPWTPTELPGSSAHTPAAVYQGADEVTQQFPPQSAVSAPNQQPPAGSRLPVNALEHDMSRMHVSEEPPPAYSQVSHPQGRYPSEKGQHTPSHSGSMGGSAAVAASVASAPSVASAGSGGSQVPPQHPQQHEHPAFANDPRQQQPMVSPNPSQNGMSAQQQPQQQQQQQQQAMPQRTPSQSMPPSSPPPLPEGWIAHIDPNSGQYYYIHLPTQATQWEFPKGPTPLALGDTPLSPTGSMYQNPLASPGLFAHGPLASPGLPHTPGFDQQSVMGLNGTLSNPATLQAQPPASGVELYKVQATNGVYFGPYLRYTNMDLELGIWYGSILLVSDAPQPPTIHIHQSLDLSPNPRQLKAVNIAKHQRWVFYKYDIDLRMEHDQAAKWTYAITSHLGCTRYEFLVAGRYETNWRFVLVSGNDFALNTNLNDRARLGGHGFMWKDIMQKHAESGGFHVQLECGGQIFADRMWKEIPCLKQWLATAGKEARKTATWTAAHEEDVTHAYFHYYTSHFDQPFLREAFAQIPYVSTIDDHDIFDGFGSYPDYMQFSNMFKNIGRIGIEMYLLFQHHTTLELLRNVSDDRDLFTITGTGWHFVKFLGPAVAVVGPDTRSERNPHQVMAGPTYQGLFPKIAMLPQSVQHCLLMLPVPLIYPRLESMESLANTVATGKKAVTGAYNMLGKVTSSVAGVVGAKTAVGAGFESVKKAVGKSGLMGGILNPFGDVQSLDELKDQWTHESKDLERTYLIRTLQGIAKNRSIRFSFLSGAVNTCGAGLVHDQSHPADHKTMYQLISSSVVAAPPPSYILKLLNNSKPLYIPANGTRSTPHVPTDTKEDMVELFTVDVTGQPNTNRRLMARRNYVAVLIYDPEAVAQQFGRQQQGSEGASAGKLSLAADFMVQGEGVYGNVVKYGPVVIPHLEYGR